MKFNILTTKKILLFTCLFFILSSIFLSSFVFALSVEEQSAFDVLEEYYVYSVEGDIDKYLAVQDPLFLIELSNDGEIDLHKFYEFTFNEVQTSDISLTDIDVVLQEQSALIFYTLKGKFETKDGETGTIDNDMVAFLWKYDEWKVRWTITRTLYEQKIAMTYFMDVVVERTFEDLNDDSLRTELEAEGFDISFENYELKDAKKGGSFILWFLFLVLLALLMFFLIYFKKIPLQLSTSKKDSKKDSKTKLKKVSFSSKITTYIISFKKNCIKLYAVIYSFIKKQLIYIHKTSIALFLEYKPKVCVFFKQIYELVQKKYKQIQSK